MAATESSLEGKIIAQVRAKQDGKAQSVLASEPLDSDVVDYIDTQASSLNYAIGRPGIPTGRLTLFTGRPKSGKSSVLYHLLQETQRRGGVAVLVDAERRYSRDRAERMGIDHARLIYMPGDDVEATFKELYSYVEVVREVLPPDKLVLIGWDSLAGTATAEEMKGVTVGSHAKLVGKWFRILLPLMAKQRIAFVMINQLRNRIDMGGGTYFNAGSKDTMIADRALSYHCSLKVHFTQIAKDGDPKHPDGITTKADVQANTVAPPFRSGLIHLTFLDGIDQAMTDFEVAKDLKLIDQHASWWSYQGKKFQRTNFAGVLEQHEELRQAIAAAPLGWMP